jgi:hypothetical protein
VYLWSKALKYVSLLLLLISATWLTGCTGITPIQSLGLPPVTVIEGTITQVDESGFMLQDASGVIFVKAQLPNGQKLEVALKEKVRIYGNLQAGPKPVFDGYVIRKLSGQQIIVTNPTPHFGFILQTSFQ